ncbi:hypothetical protein CPB86DRAFT_146989 [Serendipita vermifera]|nr:hypothetical protein CPB86DRAFT_146989 [Serendipita vermifera]
MFRSTTSISGLNVTSLVSDEKTRLMETRWHLRDEVTRILQDTNRGTKPEAIISSYNEVMDALHDLELGSRADPWTDYPVKSLPISC